VISYQVGLEDGRLGGSTVSSHSCLRVHEAERHARDVAAVDRAPRGRCRRSCRAARFRRRGPCRPRATVSVFAPCGRSRGRCRGCERDDVVFAQRLGEGARRDDFLRSSSRRCRSSTLNRRHSRPCGAPCRRCRGAELEPVVMARSRGRQSLVPASALSPFPLSVGRGLRRCERWAVPAISIGTVAPWM
jgi:hypothetical protein